MKLYRTTIFIIISSIALVAVLIIQVNWIIQTAQIKEELFNEKANIVLSKTVEALCSDKEACMNMGSCCMKDNRADCKLELREGEINKIDSLLKNYMQFYNFHIDYSFEVIKENSNTGDIVIYHNVFKKRLEEVANKNGLELKLIFPEKKQFIIAEMGRLFTTSVILIIVVLFMFWRTVLGLIKEKKISEHTTDFLNNMTHEFKTPLTNIALASKMMVKDSNIKQEDKIRHYSGIILQENEKLRIQVEQVLGMTALERGEIPLTKTQLDLHHLINEAVKCIGVQIENKNGSLKLSLNAEYYVGFGDKSHLTNALCNLIDNAIKYSKESLTINIETYNRDKKFILVVSDNAIGIEKEYINKVFVKFFRVPTGDLHDVKGFGLGLAYVKKIIELHNGTIELQSKINVGTVFIITLPLLNE